MIIQQNNGDKQVIINGVNFAINVIINVFVQDEVKKEDEEEYLAVDKEKCLVGNRIKKKSKFVLLEAEAKIKEVVSDFCIKKQESFYLEQAYVKLAKLDRIQKSRLLGKAGRVHNCGTYLEFWLNEKRNWQKLVRANYCRDRLCPTCAWRRSVKNYIEDMKCFERLQGGRYLLLTLTAKNIGGEALPNEITNYINSWNCMAKDKAIRKYLMGTVRALEVTYNRSRDDYHPHLHILLHVKDNYFSRGYLSQEKWRKMWEEYAGLDYYSQVDIRAVKMNKGVPLPSVLAEISKYCVKFSDLSDLDENTYTKVIGVLDKALSGRRLISYTGTIRSMRKKLKMTDDIKDCEIDYDDELMEEVIRVLYFYNFAKRDYIEKRVLLASEIEEKEEE